MSCDEPPTSSSYSPGSTRKACPGDVVVGQVFRGSANETDFILRAASGTRRNATELQPRTRHMAVDGADVKLHDLVARAAADVFDIDCDRQSPVGGDAGRCYAEIAISELGIAQSMPEGKERIAYEDTCK